MPFVAPPSNWRERGAGTAPPPTLAALPPPSTALAASGAAARPSTELQQMLDGVRAAFADTVGEFTASGVAAYDELPAGSSVPATADEVLAARVGALQAAVQARAPLQARLQRLIELDAQVARRREVLASIELGMGHVNHALGVADAAAEAR
jgi:hypothetical protein